jgi:hypothetical protein
LTSSSLRRRAEAGKACQRRRGNFSADSSEFLAPVEIAALQKFKEGNDVVRLSTALQLYWKAHRKSGDAAFVAKVNRDWDKLVNALGDVDLMSLNRSQA